MPFKSKSQMGAAFGGYLGKEMKKKASKWAEETPNIKKLPKRVKKEEIEGALGDVYAVQKPYSGCDMDSLVTPFNPMSGIPMDQMQPDQVHGVFPDQDRAMAVANQIYQEHMAYEQALEEKKVKVTEKLKSAMTKLERLRSNSMKMIKENPKEADPHRQKVAELTEKIDELTNKLQAIERSKKELKKDEGDKKKELKESNKKADYKIGEEIIGTKKIYFLYNHETGKKEGTYKTKEDAQKELDKKKNLKEAIAVPKGKGKVVVYKGNGEEGKNKNVLAIRFDISSNPQDLPSRVQNILDFLKSLPDSAPGGDGDEVGYIDLALPFTTSVDPKQLALQIKNSKSLEDAAK